MQAHLSISHSARQGDIGVAVSEDSGLTWKHLGIALDEPWHLSYPFLFRWEGQVYMMPEASKQVPALTATWPS